MKDTLDQYKGCMLGLACGDAVGTTLEFKPPGTFDPINDMIGGGPFSLNAGEWTDDTSMALCLAESLLTKSGFDPNDKMDRYIMWWEQGHLSSNGRCFDIGNTVRNALISYQHTGESYSGSKEEDSAGNGSIMRLAPVPLFFANNIKDAIFYSGESSKTTHGLPMCIDACRYMAGLILGILKGDTKETILSENYSPLSELWDQNPLCPEIAEIAGGSFKTKKPPEIEGAGYVVKSLEAALWAFYKTDSFKDGCLLAVNLGDDADTTGAVYGQIAGAYYGSSDIPSSWIDKLAKRDMIITFAEKLFNER